MMCFRWISIFAVFWVLFAAALAPGETAWELEAVDPNGLGTYWKVDAGPDDPNDPNDPYRVLVEGVALNTTGEYLPLTGSAFNMYTIFLQDDTGGIQVWAGSAWYPSWPVYPVVYAGQRVRVEGWVANHNGKVFINDRHSAALAFDVTGLDFVGMPEPLLIPAIEDCNYFDPSRAGGGELYQTRWCRINDVQIVSGTWGNNETLIIDDGTGQLQMKLSRMGDFDYSEVPSGSFDVVGVFDQEDPDPPYHDNYRIWVKRFSDIMYCGQYGYHVGDINEDCVVNWQDFALFAEQWLQTGPDLAGDFNFDQVVNWQDFTLFAENWLKNSDPRDPDFEEPIQQ